MKDLTIVVPSYNEEAAIPILYNTIKDVMANDLSRVDYEFLFVDDGSKDNTLGEVLKLAETDERVKYVSFSRNFGKESAIFAGLQNAKGSHVVIMDADMQDPPALLPEMYKTVTEEGFDCVGTRRVSRKGEPPVRSFFARIFYKLMGAISEAEVMDGARDYQLMNRKVVDAILSMGEYNRFSKGIFGWVGYKKHWLEYENVQRVAGETKWSFWKLFLYAIDGITAFSTVPLVMSSFMGIALCVVAMIMIVFIIVRTLIFGDPTSGWPSMVCIIMLVSGAQLLSIGVLGQYVAKIYLETKHRPLYLVSKTNVDKE